MTELERTALELEVEMNQCIAAEWQADADVSAAMARKYAAHLVVQALIPRWVEARNKFIAEKLGK